MVEQFGLAMILSALVNKLALISGTINFLSRSIRQADELSMTVVPISANFGAHSNETLPPAEKMAMVGFALTASAKPIILCFFPLYEISFPIDFSDATKSSSSIGKLRSFNT